MKKLIFLFAFAFIGGQAFSQMYIVSTQDASINSCSQYEVTLSAISPTGTITKICIPDGTNGTYTVPYDPNIGLAIINQELNSIMGQGYKLINIDYRGGLLPSGWEINEGVTFF